jgi:hypothetical protein
MKLLRIRVLFAIIAVTVFGLAALLALSLYREMKSKSEWGILQGIEFSHRLGTEDSTVVFASSNGYDAIGIRSDSMPSLYPPPRFPRVWLLASPEYGQKVKKIPLESNYAITSSDLNLVLLHEPGMSTATQEELRHHVMK